MVDTRDLKSLGSNTVWVRVPLRAIFLLRKKNAQEVTHLRASRVGLEVKPAAAGKPARADGEAAARGVLHSEQFFAAQKMRRKQRNSSLWEIRKSASCSQSHIHLHFFLLFYTNRKKGFLNCTKKSYSRASRAKTGKELKYVNL